MLINILFTFEVVIYISKYPCPPSFRKRRLGHIYMVEKIKSSIMRNKPVSNHNDAE